MTAQTKTDLHRAWTLALVDKAKDGTSVHFNNVDEMIDMIWEEL